MNHIQDLNELLATTLYINPSILVEPKIQQQIEHLSEKLFEVDPERIRQLPEPIKIATVKKVIDKSLGEIHHVFFQKIKPYLNHEIISELLSEPKETYKEIIESYYKKQPSIYLKNLNQKEITERLNHIPSDVRSSIRDLNLIECTFLEDLTSILPLFPEVSQLNLSSSFSLKTLHGIESLKTLKTLKISECRNLINLKGIEESKLLTTLIANKCSYLSALDAISPCIEIEELDLSYCLKIKSLKPIYGLDKLKKISLMGLVTLKRVDNFEKLFNLREIHIENSGVTDITPLSKLKHLSPASIYAQGCKIRQ